MEKQKIIKEETDEQCFYLNKWHVYFIKVCHRYRLNWTDSRRVSKISYPQRFIQLKQATDGLTYSVPWL